MQPTRLKKTLVVFCITDTCDKHCPSCCTQDMRRNSVMDFDRYEQKLAEVASFCRKHGTQPVLGFTGGEAFLYRQSGPRGERRTLATMLESAVRAMPDAALLVKTSGFQANAYLDGLLDSVLTNIPDTKLRFRLGFSLHQKGGHGADKRLAHMIGKILGRHSRLDVDVIYDKTQFARTMEALSTGLSEAGIPASPRSSWESVLSNPRVVHNIPFEVSGKTVVVTTEPAYRPQGCDDKFEYYDEGIPGSCHAFVEQPDAICYRPDFSIFHCNDSYVDFGVPSPPVNSFSDIGEEVAFLRAGYDELRPIMARRKSAFGTKRDACKFCTRFVLGMQPREAQQCQPR